MDRIAAIAYDNLLVSLCVHFAQDSSEQANVIATDIIKKHFFADEVALFYRSGVAYTRMSLAGSDHPLNLPLDRWDEAVRPVARKVLNPHHLTHFGPWALPGFGQTRPWWIGALLWDNPEGTGYLLLGRSKENWTRSDALLLRSIVEIIAPIVEIRNRESQARQESLEYLHRFESTVAGLPEMIYSCDPSDRIASINRAGLELLGYRKEEDLIGRVFSTLVLNASDRENLIKRVREEGSAANYEIILVNREGKALFTTESIIARRNPEGEIIEFIGLIRDITERIEGEQRLWQTSLELSAANDKLKETQEILLQQEKLASIGQLAAGIAHEINNPLGYLKSNHSSIIRYLNKLAALHDELSKRVGSDPNFVEIPNKATGIIEELKTMAAESDEGFDRIIKIIKDLKSFSRVSSPDDYATYNVNEGLESSLAIAWNEIKYVATVHKNYGELPPICANGGEINQVFLNVLVNAAQAIQEQKREGLGNIWLTTAVEEGQVTIIIADDGPGIPDEIRSRVFDPFFTTKEVGKGTGLGLSISHQIINKHGGRIRIHQRTGGGSSFLFSLPQSCPEKKK